MTIAVDSNRTSQDIEYRLLTPEVITKLANWISQGNYDSTACALVNIKYSTYLSWQRQAEIDFKAGLSEDDSLAIKLVNAVKNAEAIAEADRVSRIQKAGIGGAVTKRVTRERKDGTIETEESYQAPQWLADMTHLERRHPERWGRRDSLQVDQNQTVNVNVIVKHYQDTLPAATPEANMIEGQANLIEEKHE